MKMGMRIIAVFPQKDFVIFSKAMLFVAKGLNLNS